MSISVVPMLTPLVGGYIQDFAGWRANFAIVAVLALALSGVVAHPRIFRDAFRLRARDNGGVGLTDWHNRMSVWTLPFSVAIALTGALIGLATVTAFAIAANDYGSDVEAVYAPIFGEEGEPDPAPAPVPMSNRPAS